MNRLNKTRLLFFNLIVSPFKLQVLVDNTFQRLNVSFANADFFFTVSFVFDDFSLCTKFFELSFKLGAFVNPNFFVCFVLITFLKASAVSLAYLVFRGFTRN